MSSLGSNIFPVDAVTVLAWALEIVSAKVSKLQKGVTVDQRKKKLCFWENRKNKGKKKKEKPCPVCTVVRAPARAP